MENIDFKRIQSIQTEVNSGTWKGSKEDLALLKVAFAALEKNTLGENASSVRELSTVIVTKAVDGLSWPWVRKVASAVYRIFRGHVSLPYALLKTMTVDQLGFVIKTLDEKYTECLKGDNLIERSRKLKELQGKMQEVIEYIPKLFPDEPDARFQAYCGQVQIKIKITLLEVTYLRLQNNYKTIVGLNYNVKKNLVILADSISKQIQNLDVDFERILRMSNKDLEKDFSWKGGSPLLQLEELKRNALGKIRELG